MLKFLPLLQLAPKLSTALTEADMLGLVSAFVPKAQVKGIAATLMETREMGGEDAMAHVLNSDAAKALLKGMNEQVEEAQATVFCRCPNCQFTFEKSLESGALTNSN